MPSSPERITRRLRFSVLRDEEIARVHNQALQVLADTGLVVRYPPALQLLHTHGATVDDSREVVRIPRHLVEQALNSAPRAFTIESQSDPRKDCPVGLGDRQHGRPSTGLNWILDAGSLRRRPVTEEDAVKWTRVAQALPNMHIVSSAFDQDGSPNAMDVRAVARMLRHTDKPLMVSGLSGEGVRWMERLTGVVQGSDRKRRVVVFTSVNSPLMYGYGQAEVGMVAAELGFPVLINSTGVAGVTAPVTLVGALVQMNAELLGALVVIQLHRPGTPVLYAGHPMVMDMKTGMPSHGFSELGLATAAFIDIGRSYGLPTSSPGLMTDSCSSDAMAASEKWATGYPPVMAGADVSGGGGGLACQSTISLEQLVIDDDLYGYMFPHVQGIWIDEESLASEVIHKVGPGGSYLAEDHTLRHFREEYRYSQLANRLSAAAWERAGSADVCRRAANRLGTILAALPEPLISPEQSRELAAVLPRAEQALAALELPT